MNMPMRPVILLVMSAAFSLVMVGHAWANNLVVTNLAVSVRDTLTAEIKFDIVWENSWRSSSNHDAAWVFFKVRSDAQSAWQHVMLAGAGRNPAGYSDGAGTGIELVVPSDHLGLFVRRSAEGVGTTSVQNVKVVWNFAPSNLAPTNIVRVNAYAVEMVYVAPGSFYVGSGGSGVSEFYQYPDTNTPFLITNEAAITVGAATGNLHYAISKFGGDQGSPIPAAFPKGFNAFYCMKYELTEGQWVDFFNTLTDAQKTTRNIPGAAGKNNRRNTVVWTVGEATTSARTRACSTLSWADGCAFAAWAGLRPMTELEFEKACRGPLKPVANEYAWGDTTIKATMAVVTDNLGKDTAILGNCNFNDCLPHGPYGVGLYAVAGSMRQATGAAYWGILDLSGNLCEQIVTAGNPLGRAYTGLHGDGKLDASGNAAVPGWPNMDARGTGYCGGGWFYPCENARVSNRVINALPCVKGDKTTGWRGVRTAPLPEKK
ncbi:MAG: SUMF1/EgtB/PvdO family nonheme iron enzyme [bacterium]